MFTRLNREVLAGLLFLLFVPLLSHLLFSWMGFTPTDEGFTLAYSRRLLDGQVPHRDFIIIRRFLSPLIHVPFVWLGGASTFWISRLFVWFELATISWLWFSILNRLMEYPFVGIQKAFVALASFAATTHIKHLTAWHTIDGLFFVAIGLALCIRPSSLAKIAGYFFLGLALLCKQSFVFVLPLSLVILNDWRRIVYWTSGVLPGVMYSVYLLLKNSFGAALTQLSAQTDPLSAGFTRYLFLATVFAAIGYVSAKCVFGDWTSNEKARRWILLIMFYIGPVSGTAISLWYGVLFYTSFFLFGFLAGATMALFARNTSEAKSQLRACLFVLLIAWCASLSGGYNSPALMSGPILISVLAYVRPRDKSDRRFRYSLIGACVVIILSFGVARTKYIYRDRPAPELTRSLEGVLPGGKHIYTNPNTFDFMTDLKSAVEWVQGERKQYAILPDVAAYWVQAPQQNPLPAVWPHAQELAKPVLMNRFINAMEERRADTIFIVEKVDAKDLASGFVPLPSSDYYQVVRHVRERFTKIRETKYFELYQ